MPAPKKYPQELRGARRMVAKAVSEDSWLTLNGAVKRIAPRAGSSDTRRGWVRRADFDPGRKPGTTTQDAASIRQLQAECVS